MSNMGHERSAEKRDKDFDRRTVDVRPCDLLRTESLQLFFDICQVFLRQLLVKRHIAPAVSPVKLHKWRAREALF